VRALSIRRGPLAVSLPAKAVALLPDEPAGQESHKAGQLRHIVFSVISCLVAISIPCIMLATGAFALVLYRGSAVGVRIHCEVVVSFATYYIGVSAR
jgi:hypothetical protein